MTISSHSQLVFLCENGEHSYLAQCVAKGIQAGNPQGHNRITNISSMSLKEASKKALDKNAAKVLGAKSERKSKLPCDLHPTYTRMTVENAPHSTAGEDTKTYYFCMTRRHRDMFIPILGPMAMMGGDLMACLLLLESANCDDPTGGPVEEHQEKINEMSEAIEKIMLNLGRKGGEPFD